MQYWRMSFLQAWYLFPPVSSRWRQTAFRQRPASFCSHPLSQNERRAGPFQRGPGESSGPAKWQFRGRPRWQSLQVHRDQVLPPAEKLPNYTWPRRETIVWRGGGEKVVSQQTQLCPTQSRREENIEPCGQALSEQACHCCWDQKWVTLKWSL